jgi:hypothetical protein
MSRICPRCSHLNSPQATTCEYCKSSLLSPPPSSRPSISLPGIPNHPPFPDPHNSNSYSMGQAPQGSSPGGQTMQFAQATFPEPAPPQMGMAPASSPTTIGSFRRAFAGYGTVITHHSWLIDSQQAEAGKIRWEIEQRTLQRQFQGVTVTPISLTDVSLQTEQRVYSKIQRAVTAVFIYVAAIGHDLYISRATTVRPPISALRTFFALAMAFIIILAIFSGLAQSASSPTSMGPYGSTGYATPPPSSGLLAFAPLVILSIPVTLFSIFMLYKSTMKWITGKDFLFYLRPDSLSDFQRDDIALLEQATDETIRQTLKELGLDANKIIAPPQGYQPKQHIRAL